MSPTRSDGPAGCAAAAAANAAARMELPRPDSGAATAREDVRAANDTSSSGISRRKREATAGPPPCAVPEASPEGTQQVQLILGAGHTNVAEPTLLLKLIRTVH